MPEEYTEGIPAEELGLEPEEIEEQGVATAVQPDGSIGITDEIRQSVLYDAIQRGEMVPSAWANNPQPSHVPQRADDDDDSESLVFKGDMNRMIADAREQAKREAMEAVTAQFGPALAQIQAQSIAQEVEAIAPEAAPIARQLVEQMGASAANMAPDVRKLVIDAAIGRSVREGRGRQLPSHEGNTSSAPRYQLANGYDAQDVAFYQKQFESIYGRKATAAELRNEGFIR